MGLALINMNIMSSAQLCNYGGKPQPPTIAACTNTNLWLYYSAHIEYQTLHNKVQEDSSLAVDNMIMSGRHKLKFEKVVPEAQTGLEKCAWESHGAMASSCPCSPLHTQCLEYLIQFGII